MSEPTGKSGLLPCPICGSDAKDYTRPRERDLWPVCCTSHHCLLNHRGIPRGAWQVLPRQPDAVMEVVREMQKSNWMGSKTIKDWADRLSRIADKGDGYECEIRATPEGQGVFIKEPDSRPAPPAECERCENKSWYSKQWRCPSCGHTCATGDSLQQIACSKCLTNPTMMVCEDIPASTPRAQEDSPAPPANIEWYINGNRYEVRKNRDGNGWVWFVNGSNPGGPADTIGAAVQDACEYFSPAPPATVWIPRHKADDPFSAPLGVAASKAASERRIKEHCDMQEGLRMEGTISVASKPEHWVSACVPVHGAPAAADEDDAVRNGERFVSNVEAQSLETARMANEHADFYRAKSHRYLKACKRMYREWKAAHYGTGPRFTQGMMCEYSRLDGMWQKMVADRDAARAEVDAITEQRDQAIIDRDDYWRQYQEEVDAVIGLREGIEAYRSGPVMGFKQSCQYFRSLLNQTQEECVNSLPCHACNYDGTEDAGDDACSVCDGVGWQPRTNEVEHPDKPDSTGNNVTCSKCSDKGWILDDDGDRAFCGCMDDDEDDEDGDSVGDGALEVTRAMFDAVSECYYATKRAMDLAAATCGTRGILDHLEAKESK